MMPWINVGVLILVLLVTALTVLAGVVIWRNGFVRGWRASRSNPPTCLACGYNLSGLTECRCPECGRVYRLDELWQTANLRKS